VVRHGTKERATRGSSFRAAQIPVEMRRQALTRLVKQRRIIDGRPYLVIGTQVQRDRLGRERPTDISDYVFVSLEDEERTLANLGAALSQAGAVALVLAVGVALVSARSVLLPVRRLGAAARDLGAGKLDTRLPVQGRDELAHLTA